jgi:ATP-dependent RNA helicase RhlE
MVSESHSSGIAVLIHSLYFMQPPVNSVNSFDGLGISPNLRLQLEKLQFKIPTPIQSKAIPIALEGKDLIGIAQTGTGKTLAFGIPMIQRLAAMPETAQGLILLPTRELAEQVEISLKRLVPGLPMVLVIGGAPAHRQIQALQRNPKIIVATPGRLIDLMQEKKAHVRNVALLVLDEADRMLDMGFAPQIEKILSAMLPDRQTMLFSATMPTEITKLATRYMRLPLRIEVARPGTTAARVEQELFVVPREMKAQLLEKLLKEYRGTVLVFSRTKHGATKLTRLIREMGYTADEIHANRSLGQRRNALAGFKSGKYRVLVATDIASRGIDVTGIELVVNYDLPDNPEDYVHRIGRTARAGSSGKAISFATSDQAKEVSAIERVIRTQLPMRKSPTDLPPRRMMPRIEEHSDPRASGGRGGSRFGSPRRSSSSPSRFGSSSSAAPRSRDGEAPRRSGPPSSSRFGAPRKSNFRRR